jgi:hypothetical protein
VSKYSLAPVEDLEKWDTFVEKSPQGTLFSLSCYLNAVGQPFELLYVVKGKEIRAGIALIKDAQGNCTLHDFVIYNGLLFSPQPKNQNHVKRLSDEFEILTFVSDALPQQIPKIKLALSPGIKDLRPFIWHNYDCKKAVRWALDLRYTCYVDISGCQREEYENTPLFKEMGTSRRQEIRYARRNRVFAEQSSDVGCLVDLYSKTMEKGGGVDLVYLNLLKSLLLKLLDDGKGKQFIVKNDQNEVVSAAFFGFDNKRAYYLFGGSDPKKQTSYSGTVVLWDVFVALSREGIYEVDMEGVNSPQRGWFKLSMGGSLLPYYELKYGW